MSRKRTNPFVAALIGIFLIPASVCLHAWNEYRTIHRTRGLQEAAEIVQSIPDPERVESKWDGTLVHLTGTAATDETLRDPIFGVEANGIKLHRNIEMYQWDEDSDTDDGRTSYSYRKVWREGRIDSSQFEHSGHENPQLHFDQWQQTAGTVMVGKYRISDALIQQKNDDQSVRIDVEAIKQNIDESDAAKLSAYETGLYYSQSGQSASDPSIGDLKIRFSLVPNGPVSLMAGLSGNTFNAFHTSNGEPIERLYPGTLSAQQVIEKLKFENTLMAWGLRALGLILCLVGTMMIFSPAQALFRWVPLVGDIAGGMIFLVSVLFAICLSLTTISISWIAVRPLLAISLLFVAGAAAYWIIRTRRGVQTSHPVPSNDDEPIMLTDDMMVS
mgnify:CR=1 FL=1|tara:strand:- start:75699 stop:76859 length:1161 start_codon:yes stop_codon:yes gene_type:complete